MIKIHENLNIENQKTSIIILVMVIATIVSFLDAKIKILLIFAEILLIYFLIVNYKKQVQVLILIYPLTDFINEKIIIYKSILGVYIICLFLKTILLNKKTNFFKEKIVKAYGLLILICIVSCIYAPYKKGAIEEIIRYCSMMSMLGVVYLSIQNSNDIYKMYTTFLKASIIPIIVGIFQIIFRDGMMYGQYDRVISTFAHSSKSGFYFAILSINFILLFLNKKSNIFIKNKKILILFNITSILILYKTYTRSAWIDFFITLITIIIVWHRNAILYIFYIALPFTFFAFNKIDKRLTSELTSTGPLVVNIFGKNITGSYASRIFYWQYGLQKMFKNHKIFGTGISSFFYTFSPTMMLYLTGKRQQVEIHNDFIKLLCEIGLFGITIYLIVIFVVFKELIIGLKTVKNNSDKIIIKSAISTYLIATMGHFTDVLFRLYSVELTIAIILGIAIKTIKISKYTTGG